jgi:hypothetical protein
LERKRDLGKERGQEGRRAERKKGRRAGGQEVKKYG